ncbi:MAG: WD40 repeat domain-containing protein [Phycisphaeraceae bacterium]
MPASIRLFAVAVLLCTLQVSLFADDQPVLVAQRQAYLNTEPIRLTLPGEATADAHVVLTVRHSDGSTVQLDVPVNAPETSRVVTLEPGALKPGAYTAWVGERADASSPVRFTVTEAEPTNPYFIAQWAHHAVAPGESRAKSGWMYFNSDLVSLRPEQVERNRDMLDGYVRAGMRPYARMVLGGGHQLDLKLRNDWGDPWVQRAVAWRMNLTGLAYRHYPLRGLHVFDEPGLTWWPIVDSDGEQLGASPFSIPHQIEEFKKRTGVEMPDGTFQKTLPKYKDMMDDWLAFMDMRMKYLEQAWYASVWGTRSVHESFRALNQVSSSYAAGGVTDGVDSRQARPYELVGAHGGYADRPFGTFEPLLATEAARGFVRDRPQYYLPMWDTHTPETMRAAVWMSWASKLEGMMYTPEQDFHLRNKDLNINRALTVFEVAELNRRLARIGGVMNQLPKTPAPVAVLHSHRQFAHDLAEHNHPELADGGPPPPYYSPHHQAVKQSFFRVMDTGTIPNWIDEHEATTQGAEFLAQWEVIFLPGLATATDAFRQVLRQYARNGGTLVQHADDELKIEGAVRADYRIAMMSEYAEQRESENLPTSGDLAVRDWNRQLAPTFHEDLAEWVGDLPYDTTNGDVVLGVHRAGDAAYLLFANNAQSEANPRNVQHELIPSETEVTMPDTGVVYDLLEGGTVSIRDGRGRLRLPAGGGACWLHLPEPPGEPNVRATLHEGNRLHVTVEWGRTGYLPFELRVIDPQGNPHLSAYRATTPGNGATQSDHTIPLGANAQPGAWRVEVREWLTDSTTRAEVNVPAFESAQLAAVEADEVSVYFEDARKIHGLFAGEPMEPDYNKLNWDTQRVFDIEPDRFAIFGDPEPAQRIAKALRVHGMRVEINPAYTDPAQIEPEEGRGMAGPRHGDDSYETIAAHAIVLPGHELAQKAQQRGHINFPSTEHFPGRGRAHLQWGISCFQAGWQSVFVFGDTDAGVDWLIEAMRGEAAQNKHPLDAQVTAVSLDVPKLPRQLHTRRTIELYDTPMGVALSADGQRTFVALYDGSVTAYGDGDAVQWQTAELLRAHTLALSPDGERLAVAGDPGVLVLDTEDGAVLGGYRAEPVPRTEARRRGGQIRTVAWSEDGARLAAAWSHNRHHPQPMVVLDREGEVRQRFDELTQDVFGLTFVPGTRTLLVGGEALVALDTDSGQTLWQQPLAGARAFAFAPDGETVTVGCWSETVARLRVENGQVLQRATVEGIVGGVARLPSGAVAVAVWGGTTPLLTLPDLEGSDSTPADEIEPQPLFASEFAFQDVAWSDALNALVATEQGGRLWLLGVDGQPQAQLGRQAGTTAHRLHVQGSHIAIGRMDRSVTVLSVK